MNGEKVTFYGSSLYKADKLPADAKELPAPEVPGGKIFVHGGGLLLPASDDKFVSAPSLSTIEL